MLFNTDPKVTENVVVDFQSLLVHSRGQSGIETLRELRGYGSTMRQKRNVLWMTLDRLHRLASALSLYNGERSGYLQQSTQKGNIVSPLLRCSLPGAQGPLHDCCISAQAFVRFVKS